MGNTTYQLQMLCMYVAQRTILFIIMQVIQYYMALDEHKQIFMNLQHWMIFL